LKKIFIIIFFLSTGLSLYSQSSWIKQICPTNTFLKKCVFADSLYGWAIGDSGIIINTANGGNTWSVQYRKSDHYFRDIFFLNKYSGWAVAWINDQVNYGSVIYKTTNSGINWNYQNFPDSNVYMNCIYFLNPNKGFLGCAGYFSSIFFTTDAGNNWLPCNVDSSFFSNFPVNTIDFYNSNTGFALGGYYDISGIIWRTTNGGLSWNEKSVGPEPMNGIAYLDSVNYLVSGGDYEYGASILKTSNAGNNWEYIPLNEFGIGYNISLRTTTEGYIPLGFSRTVLKSTNRGNNWIPFAFPDSASIYYICFVNSRNGWGVGYDGAVYKYDPNPSYIHNLSSVIPENISLLQNYPNPFNSSTVLKFILENNSFVNIIIYDITGKELMTLLNRRLYKGENSVLFTNRNLSSGIYFYKISAENSYKFGKMIILN
jgi:photosystem II stability/assembly factor-like uncharacterized protein